MPDWSASSRGEVYGTGRSERSRTVPTIDTEEPLAVDVVDAIHAGDVPRLQELLAEHPGLAAVRLGDDDPDGMNRSLLHVATDWPGHFPNVAATIEVLVAAGADVDRALPRTPRRDAAALGGQ